MIASIVSDAFMGFGCVIFAFMILAAGLVVLAIKLGLLPGLLEQIKQKGHRSQEGEQPKE